MQYIHNFLNWLNIWEFLIFCLEYIYNWDYIIYFDIFYTEYI